MICSQSSETSVSIVEILYLFIKDASKTSENVCWTMIQKLTKQIKKFLEQVMCKVVKIFIAGC